MNKTYQINFYVPEEHLDSVKEAMFEAGAGRIGEYDYCAWQILGEGQFKPLEGSNPYSGTKNVVKKAPEYKVELVCEEKFLKDVIGAMKKAHPYETPAYSVIELVNI
jgi:hypothetical protein